MDPLEAPADPQVAHTDPLDAIFGPLEAPTDPLQCLKDIIMIMTYQRLIQPQYRHLCTLQRPLPIKLCLKAPPDPLDLTCILEASTDPQEAPNDLLEASTCYQDPVYYNIQAILQAHTDQLKAPTDPQEAPNDLRQGPTDPAETLLTHQQRLLSPINPLETLLIHQILITHTDPLEGRTDPKDAPNNPLEPPTDPLEALLTHYRLLLTQ